MATVRTMNGGGFDTAPFQKVLLIAVGILLFPLAWKYIRNFFQSEQDAQADKVAENPVLLKSAMDVAYEDFHPLAQPKEVYQSGAKQLYEALHIPKKWYHWLLPSYWSEDDEEAVRIILSTTGGYSGAENDYMSVCYMLISGSDRRDMVADVKKYVDKDLIEKWELFYN